MMFISELDEAIENFKLCFELENGRTPNSKELREITQKALFKINQKKWRDERKKNKKKDQEIVTSGKLHPNTTWSDGSPTLEECIESDLCLN